MALVALGDSFRAYTLAHVPKAYTGRIGGGAHPSTGAPLVCLP